MNGLAETFQGCSPEQFETALIRYARPSVYHQDTLYNTVVTLIATHNDVKLELFFNARLLDIEYVPTGNMSLFHHAAKHRCDTALERLCALFPRHLENTLHPHNHTPLTECARSGYLFGARKLLDLGCSLHRAKTCAALPIFNAGSSAMVRLLAKYGGPIIFSPCRCNAYISYASNPSTVRTFVILSGDRRHSALVDEEQSHQERKRVFFSTSLVWILLVRSEVKIVDRSEFLEYQDNQ